MTDASAADINLLAALDHAIQRLLALELEVSELRIELAKAHKALRDRLTAEARHD